MPEGQEAASRKMAGDVPVPRSPPVADWDVAVNAGAQTTTGVRDAATLGDDGILVLDGDSEEEDEVLSPAPMPAPRRVLFKRYRGERGASARGGGRGVGGGTRRGVVMAVATRQDAARKCRAGPREPAIVDEPAMMDHGLEPLFSEDDVAGAWERSKVTYGEMRSGSSGRSSRKRRCLAGTKHARLEFTDRLTLIFAGILIFTRNIISLCPLQR